MYGTGPDVVLHADGLAALETTHGWVLVYGTSHLQVAEIDVEVLITHGE